MKTAPSDSPRMGRLKALGPGLLFAAAAVGVSHLVQSTRAGAGYGFAFFIFVLLANAVKYPAFRFGPHYAAATGTSLLEGYRRQGRWALLLYGLLTLGTMFAVQAAVTLVTAALAIHLLGDGLSLVVVSALLLALSALLLGVGRYRWLERLAKVVVTLLALSTFAATALALPAVDWASIPLWPRPGMLDTAGILFLAALVGWMPSAIDVAVWQSLWAVERAEEAAREGYERPNIAAVTFDFHVGYFGTVLLALCFLALGSAVMYGSGEAVATSPAGFAAQLVELYARTLGGWSRPLIAFAAFLVMLSTTLTVVDGFPRALAGLYARLRCAENPSDGAAERGRTRGAYWLALGVLSVGSLVVLQRFLTSLTAMVDIATTLSFLTAPLLSILNHRAVLGPEVPLESRPPSWLILASRCGIVAQLTFGVYYVWLRFFT